jgi:hypothetical protein
MAMERMKRHLDGIPSRVGEWLAKKVRSRPFLSRLGQPLLKTFAHIRTIGDGAPTCGI